MSERTAYRFMDVAKVYEFRFATVANLDPSALYELAAPKTPLEVREEVERMIEAGEVVKRRIAEYPLKCLVKVMQERWRFCLP